MSLGNACVVAHTDVLLNGCAWKRSLSLVLTLSCLRFDQAELLQAIATMASEATQQSVDLNPVTAMLESVDRNGVQMEIDLDDQESFRRLKHAVAIRITPGYR